MDFPDVVNAWLANSSSAHLSELYAAIQSQPNYTSAPNFAPAAEALRVNDHHTALDSLATWMPGAFLSPLAHGMLAQALIGLGRMQDAELEQRLSRAALVTIVNSGDGTRTHPWTVLRISDEYDVLNALGESRHTQLPITDGNRLLDRITTDQGRTHWFELYRAGRRLKRVAA